VGPKTVVVARGGVAIRLDAAHGRCVIEVPERSAAKGPVALDKPNHYLACQHIIAHQRAGFEVSTLPTVGATDDEKVLTE
jgi:hypothetical protein